MQAIRLIKENLPIAVTDGKNKTARQNMQIAATMAGWAFTIAQVGLAHAMAHTLGALNNIPHGAACGIVLPKVMRYNAEFAADKLAMVAQALGIMTPDMDKKTAAMAAAADIESLMKKVGHPLRLRDMGVLENQLDMCALHAMGDMASMFNARPVGGPQEIIDLYKEAY